MGHKTAVHMMTVTARAEAAAETQAAFKAVGVPVTHVALQTEAPSLRMNGVNYIRAISAARGEDVFVIEDDLIPANTLSDWLAWIETQGFTVPVMLYVHNEQHLGSPEAREAFLGKRKMKPGVVPVSNLHLWWGSQAIWYPAAFLKPFMEQDRIRWLAYELDAFDVELRKYCLDKGIVPLVTVPHLVQHRDYTRVAGAGVPAPHKTRLFDADAPIPGAAVVENSGDTLADEVPTPPKSRVKTKEK